jgi:hypothetical protein
MRQLPPNIHRFITTSLLVGLAGLAFVPGSNALGIKSHVAPYVPYSLAAGPNASIWMLADSVSVKDGIEDHKPFLLRIGHDNSTQRFELGDFGSRGRPSQVLVGPDGHPWVLSNVSPKGDFACVLRLGSGGLVRSISLGDSLKISGAFGPDGNFWFAGGGRNGTHVGRVDGRGRVKEFAVDTGGGDFPHSLDGLTMDSHGALWTFTLADDYPDDELGIAIKIERFGAFKTTRIGPGNDMARSGSAIWFSGNRGVQKLSPSGASKLAKYRLVYLGHPESYYHPFRRSLWITAISKGGIAFTASQLDSHAVFELDTTIGIATAGGTVNEWHMGADGVGEPGAMAFSSDGTLLVGSSEVGLERLWDPSFVVPPPATVRVSGTGSTGLVALKLVCRGDTVAWCSGNVNVVTRGGKQVCSRTYALAGGARTELRCRSASLTGSSHARVRVTNVDTYAGHKQTALKSITIRH